MRPTLAIAGALSILAAGTLAQTQPEPPASDAVTQEQALDDWSKVYAVFSHPRCANCHVGSDGIPIWSGPSYGPEPRPHGMFVAGGRSRVGAEFIPCRTCHGEANVEVPHGAPGVRPWALAPAEMQWHGKTSAEICAQIKDEDRTGGRSVSEVADHVVHDALVLWGWEPGPGREPAPFSPEEVAEFLRMWDAAGAPCPQE
jgi:mono/diheme cytochrome c family protein